jgi:hypothetical protein
VHIELLQGCKGGGGADKEMYERWVFEEMAVSQDIVDPWNRNRCVSQRELCGDHQSMDKWD